MKTTLYSKKFLAVCIFFIASFFSFATSALDAGLISSTSVESVVSIDAALNPGTIISDVTICYNGSVGTLSTFPATGGCGTKANKMYQWQSSPDGVSYSNIVGATNTNYSVLGLKVTTYFRRSVTDLCLVTVQTAPLKITVAAAPIAFSPGTIGTTGIICSGSTANLISVTSASGGYDGSVITYQWFSNESGSYVSIPGATNSTYTTPALTSTVSFRRYSTATSSCGSYNGYSNIVTISTTTALPASASISGNFSQCPGYTNITYTAAGIPGAGANSYVWTLPSGVTAVSGQTTKVITVSFESTFAGGTISVAGVNQCGLGATKSATINLGSCNWVWTGATNTDWTKGSNWSMGIAPLNTSNVTIPNVTNKPIINSAIAKANIVVIDAGSSLTILGTGVLNISSDLTNNGILTTASTAKIQTARTSGVQVFSGDLSGIKYFVKAAGSTLQLANNWVVTGRIDLESGFIDVNNNILTIDVVNGGYIGYKPGDSGSIIGNVTVTKPLGQFTHNIATPLTGVTAGQINDDFQVINSTNGKSRLFEWNPATQKWSAPLSGLPLNTNLVPGKGYNFYATTAGVLDFTGTYAQTASPYVLSGTANSAGDFFLYGNPYLADLNWDNINKSNVDATVYYWNQSVQAYATYTTGGASSNGGSIKVPVMQGFFVTSIGTGTASISIDPNAIYNTAPTSTFYRLSSPSDGFNLIVKDGTGKSDEVSIIINDDATDGFDSALDAYKLTNPSTSLNMYTISGKTDYAVNNIPSSAIDQPLTLGFLAPVSGIYTLESSNVNLSANDVYIKDNVTGTITPINSLPYTFTAESTDAPERFSIMFRTSLTTSTQSAAINAGIRFASFQKDLVILNQSLELNNATIIVSDLSGNVVKSITGTTISNNSIYSLSDLTGGMYMIKIVDEVNGNTYSGKISIQ